MSPAQYSPKPDVSSVTLTPDEMEVIRLVDLEGLSQEEAGRRMGVSRGTIWRILRSARLKLARALVEGRVIVITPHQNLEGKVEKSREG